jgi:nitrogen fixation NifU-like protein
MLTKFNMLRPFMSATNPLRLNLLGVQAVRGFAYHENVLDHYSNPRNVGTLDKNSKFVGTGLVGAPACGDVMKL